MIAQTCFGYLPDYSDAEKYMVEVIVRAGANRFSLWRPLCFAAICWNDVISTARLKPIKELHRCYIGSIERVILHPFGLNTPHLKNSFFPCMKHEGISRLCHANGSDWGFTPHDPCFAVWIGLLDHWLQDLDVCVGKMMRILPISYSRTWHAQSANVNYLAYSSCLFARSFIREGSAHWRLTDQWIWFSEECDCSGLSWPDHFFGETGKSQKPSCTFRDPRAADCIWQNQPRTGMWPCIYYLYVILLC